MAKYGAWLSLVERCVRDAKAAGSNPVAPTIYHYLPFTGSEYIGVPSFYIFDDIIEAVPPRDFRLGYQKRNIPRKISALRNQIIVQIFCRLNIAEGMLLKYDTESLIAFIIYSISSDVFSSDSDRRSELCAIL